MMEKISSTTNFPVDIAFQHCFEHLKSVSIEWFATDLLLRDKLRRLNYSLLFSEGSGNSLMNRDDKLRQVAAEFGFDPDEEIRIGGKYTPILIDGSTAYISGQIPRVGEVVHFVGVVGESVSLDDGRRAAGISTLRALSLVGKHCGTLDAIATVPRITVYVRSAPGFTMQSEVADGASEVLYAVLGDAGVHTRSSVGVLQLPKGASVEADFIFGLNRSDAGR